MSKRLIGILLGASFILAGCGQSGPLYLPPPPKPVKQSMPPKPSTVQANIENNNSDTVVLPQAN